MKVHSEEFKREAARIALTSGLTHEQVATDLGIGKSSLSMWVSMYRPSKSGEVPESDLVMENERLRRKNRMLREERDILKKATQLIP